MRPEIDIYWVEGPPFCRLVGLFKQRIECGALLLKILTRPQLLAFIGHELGHRNLYHIERVHAIIIATYALTAYLAWAAWWWAPLAYVGGIALANFARLVWHEFEADIFTMLNFPASDYYNATQAVHRAWTAADRPSWVMRKRIAMMKRWAKIP